MPQPWMVEAYIADPLFVIPCPDCDREFSDIHGYLTHERPTSTDHRRLLASIAGVVIVVVLLAKAAGG